MLDKTSQLSQFRISDIWFLDQDPDYWNSCLASNFKFVTLNASKESSNRVANLALHCHESTSFLALLDAKNNGKVTWACGTFCCFDLEFVFLGSGAVYRKLAKPHKKDDNIKD